MEKGNKDLMAYTLHGVPVGLWTKFKVLAASRGMSIRDLLINIMAAEVIRSKDDQD